MIYLLKSGTQCVLLNEQTASFPFETKIGRWSFFTKSVLSVDIST